MIFVAVISDYLLPMCLYNIAWEMLLWLEPDLKSFSTRDVQQKKAELSAPHQAGFQQRGFQHHVVVIKAEANPARLPHSLKATASRRSAVVPGRMPPPCGPKVRTRKRD